MKLDSEVAEAWDRSLSPRQRIVLRAPSPVRPAVLAIAASTGGPPVLFSMFRELGRRLDVPIFITQHMPPMFTAVLAERLRAVSGLESAEAIDGEKVAGGHIYVAPGDRHMTVMQSDGDIRLSVVRGPRENYCRPAADPMLRSLGAVYGDRVLAVILTGMGRDGLKGARAIVAARGTVICQDEASSVVWGMPGACAMAGLSSAVLPGDRIASYVLNAFRVAP